MTDSAACPDDDHRRIVDVLAALADLRSDLAGVIAPTEAGFLSLGEALATARTRLSDGTGHFHALSDQLEGREDDHRSNRLMRAREGILAITAETRMIAASLDHLGHVSESAVGRPLTVLGKIIAEISALGINAKIHAAQVDAQGIDFSVFTRDIDRLHSLAEDTIKRAEGQLGKLAQAMAAARQSSDSFHRSDARELDTIAARLEGLAAELTGRRLRVQNALPDFSRRTMAVGERISRCISGLQVNDLTSQRIEHVRVALGLMRGLALPAEGADETGAFLVDLDGTQKRRLLAAVIMLQSRQLERAADDFVRTVGDLKADLSALAGDASSILAEALALFGGDGGDCHFIDSLAVDVERASALLENYCLADERLRQLIHQISAVFSLIANDLSALRSIDADLRIMGLNATLKCTRLGSSGHALGVVAQELRSCSRRTEETSRQIARGIDDALGEARSLAERSEREHQAAAALAEAMTATARSMRQVSTLLETTLGALVAACDQVATMVAGAVENITIDRMVRDGVGAAVRRMADLSHRAWADPIDPALVRDDIQRMLAGHYTMASERMIHDLFAEGESSPAPSSAAPVESSSDIDSFFF